MSIQRHTLYNLAGQLLPLLLALATIPTLLAVIGETRYGVLALVWLSVGYLGLFDLGMGPAISQKLAGMAQDTPDAIRKRAATFWTAVAVNLMLGVGCALIAWPLAAYIVGLGTAMNGALRLEVLQALPWIALTVPVVTVSSVLVGALQAKQHFGDINLINTAGNAGVQLLPLWWAWQHGPEIAGLVQAVFIARLVTAVLLLHRCRQLVAVGLRPTWDQGAAAGLMVFGGWVTVTAVIGPVMVGLDRFVIGWLYGARAVSYYTIAFQLAERITVLSSSLNFALFPRLAANQTDYERSTLGIEAVTALVLVLSPFVAAAILLIGPFLSWWISAEMAAVATPVAQVFLMGFWINSLALVPYHQLQAQGRPDLVAKCHLLELLPYVALLYIAVQKYGLMGAAVVFCVRATVDFILLAGFAGALKRSLPVMAVPACGLLLICSVVLTAAPLSMWQWVGGLSLCAGLLAWSLQRAPLWLREAVSRRLLALR